MSAPSLEASATFPEFSKRICENPYPGRGIVLGRNTAHQWIQIYWIMGRSEHSRNRVFEEKNQILQTQAADPSKVADPSLIIYNAMREMNGCYIVTNGSHTDAICEGFNRGNTFEATLLTQSHEPDAPHFTPRIAGCLDLHQNRGMLSLIKANAFDSNHSDHYFFHYSTMAQGQGYALTTYQHDGNPLPSFEGVPFLAPLQGEASQIAEFYWESLNPLHKIALAVKTIDPAQKRSHTLILNKYQPQSSMDKGEI